MLALCFCLSNLKQKKTDRELISFPAKHIVRLITGLMSSSSTKGKLGWRIETLVTFSSFAFKSVTLKTWWKQLVYFLLDAFFEADFYSKRGLHFLWKHLSRNSIFYWCCCLILLLQDNEKWETKIHVALFNLSSSESHVCFAKKFSNHR